MREKAEYVRNPIKKRRGGKVNLTPSEAREICAICLFNADLKMDEKRSVATLHLKVSERKLARLLNQELNGGGLVRSIRGG